MGGDNLSWRAGRRNSTSREWVAVESRPTGPSFYLTEESYRPMFSFTPVVRTLAALAALLTSAAAAQVAQSPEASTELVTTHHQIVVNGKTLRYTATAGLLPIADNEAGEPHARMFFVAYVLDRGANAPVRPLTFLWNGGPGSSSSQVHLLGFGPKRIKTADVFPTNPVLSESELLDNQETWLDQSDLVFVDPVGTGYSRPTKPQYAAEFYNTRGDIESVAEFIRMYRTRFDAWSAPLFIAGESYGTTRAQGVVEALERRRTRVAGVMLISGGMAAGQVVPPNMQSALLVPGFTATAFYHKKLPPDLQTSLQDALRQSESWARNEYATALARRDSLTPEDRAAIVSQLAHFTGMNPSVIDQKTLTLTSNDFDDRLLQDRGLQLGRYDARLANARNLTTTPWEPHTDPSLGPIIDLMLGTSPLLIRYLRNELQFKSDLLYQGPFGEGYPGTTKPRGDWMSTRWNGGAMVAQDSAGRGRGSVPFQNDPPFLRRAMEIDPKLRVLVARGLYDSGGCVASDYAISRVDPGFRERIQGHCYGGGHMMYTDKEARQGIKRDVTEFMREALAGASPSRSTP